MIRDCEHRSATVISRDFKTTPFGKLQIDVVVCDDCPAVIQEYSWVDNGKEGDDVGSKRRGSADCGCA